jgi:acetate kinase
VNRVLALNAGSSSLKAAAYRLADGEEPVELGRVSLELDSSHGTESAIRSALATALERLPAGESFGTVVHRIVHGGQRAEAVELTPEVIAELSKLSRFAPLHQPIALALVEEAAHRWPQARQVGAFDTSWHRSMPEKHRVLPLPQTALADGVERYGFHGLAFQSAMRKLAAIAPELAQGRIVLAHLGGGSSLCAVAGGRSVNTTMGLTPLAGIPMATRPGSLDPGVILHLQDSGMDRADLERMLWRESGLLGISGESGDMRVLLASASPKARLAIDAYTSAVSQGIAAMAACIGGIDALVFTGGIGANSAAVRHRVVADLAWMGLSMADQRAQVPELSLPGSGARQFALDIDEERELLDELASLTD